MKIWFQEKTRAGYHVKQMKFLREGMMISKMHGDMYSYMHNLNAYLYIKEKFDELMKNWPTG